MRNRLSSRLAVASGAVAALILLVAPNGGAAKRQRTIELKLRLAGAGSVHVSGGKRFTCDRPSCRHTFVVRLGQRLVLRASPRDGWRLKTWAGACSGTAASCSLRLQRPTRVAATFVPPGSRSNPYPLGTAVRLDGAWRLTVNSATIDADIPVEAVTDAHGSHVNPPPPAGEQYTLVDVSLTYVGTGTSNVSGYVRNWLGTEGALHTQYPFACRPPPLDLGSVVEDNSTGESLTGNLCYEIGSSDASTLLLLGTVTTSPISFKTVYFALHTDEPKPLRRDHARALARRSARCSASASRLSRGRSKISSSRALWSATQRLAAQAISSS